MRIYYGNKINTAGSPSNGELFASSTTYDTYAPNVAHPFRGIVWKSGTSSANEWLDIRFSAAKMASAFLVIDHTLVLGSDTLTLKANSSQSWSSPPFSQSITIPASGIISKTFTPANYQYWRLELTKPSAGTQRQIGVLMLCDYYDTPHQPDSDGYDEETVDPSRVSKSYDGQVYVEKLSKYRKFSTKFSSIDATFAGNLKTIFNAVGISGQCVVQVESTGELTELIYCRMDDSYSRQVGGVDSTLLWDTSLDFEEFV